VESLWHWILWAEDHEVDYKIKGEICHDLNGIDDEWAVPRTAGY